MRDAVTEYVELCEQLAALEESVESALYARLDELWYTAMTASDRDEAEKRLTKLLAVARERERSGHAARRTTTGGAL